MSPSKPPAPPAGGFNVQSQPTKFLLTCEYLLTYDRTMDEVFKAINDPGRRKLLDALFERDGQTLTELTRQLPDMTRFGVMSHLNVLEDADLISTRRDGRSKLHFLNPVPIRLIHDRWITKYTERLVGALADLKSQLEEGSVMQQPVHVYKTFINASLQKVWDAIVDGDQSVQYFYGTRVQSGWAVGDTIVYTYPDGQVAADGEVIAIDPPQRLERTFHARWDSALEEEGPVREVWSLTERDGVTELTLELYGVTAESATYAEFTGGYAYIISGMKSFIETGAGFKASA